MNIKNCPLPLSLMRDWELYIDKALIIEEWFSQFDLAPSLTDEPDRWDQWVNLIEDRLARASEQDQKYLFLDERYQRLGLASDKADRDYALAERNRILNFDPWKKVA